MRYIPFHRIRDTTVNSNNQLVGPPYHYDAAGNLINDGSHSYAYDANDQIKSVDGGSTASYVYDAFGHRVSKTAGGVSTDYVYDILGRVVAEIGGAAEAPVGTPAMSTWAATTLQNIGTRPRTSSSRINWVPRAS